MKMELVRARAAMGGLVAEVAGKVIGFILGEASGWEYGAPDATGHIDTIGMNPRYKGHGVATMPLWDFISRLNKPGVKKVATPMSTDARTTC